MKRDEMDKWNHDCYCDEVSNRYRSATTREDNHLLKMIDFYRLYGGKVIKQMHRDLLRARLKVKIMKPTIKLISMEREDLKNYLEFSNRAIKRLRKQIEGLQEKPEFEKMGKVLDAVYEHLESINGSLLNDAARLKHSESLVAIVLTGVRDDKQNDNG